MLYICNMRDILFKYLDKNYYINENGEIVRFNNSHDIILPHIFLTELKSIFGINSIQQYLDEWLNLISEIKIDANYWDNPYPFILSNTIANELVSIQPMSPPSGNIWLQEWLDICTQQAEGKSYMCGVDVAFNGDSFTVSEVRHEISGDTLVVNVDLEQNRGISEIELDFKIQKSGSSDMFDDIYE